VQWNVVSGVATIKRANLEPKAYNGTVEKWMTYCTAICAGFSLMSTNDPSTTTNAQPIKEYGIAVETLGMNGRAITDHRPRRERRLAAV
jgi:hypothetical protein